ncbi:MAG TPA: hypothetical protein PLE99_14900 [Candidatus Thiothrix moscowensis]|uniref:hypothetical protein n=1 Tax=unclassified Thiothrix TaxID=2636184 RepID=UPI0025F3089B|nr:MULTISPECIES: hypothetical protein [unclassified Thiothrix]HRJ54044.1 hypothetical protein [Candidatus Thiothrix moscowensis]HRJ94190.1 hypothetical protein [Candidatus Thiothrix moscowensis]
MTMTMTTWAIVRGAIVIVGTAAAIAAAAAIAVQQLLDKLVQLIQGIVGGVARTIGTAIATSGWIILAVLATLAILISHAVKQGDQNVQNTSDNLLKLLVVTIQGRTRGRIVTA